MSNDKLIITINRKTPTVNHLWGFRGFNRYLKTEGKEFVNYINNTIPTQIKDINYEELKKTELKVEVNIYENWYTKKGLVARKDADNRVKFLMDKVFDCININDKFIFEQGEYENLPLRKLKQIEFHLRQLKKEFDGKEVISNL